MAEDILRRFTSRKFIAAAAAFATAILSTTGVIDAAQEVELAGYVVSAIYILVEGANDLRS